MVGAKGMPRGWASSASCASRSSRIRRKRIQVSSGTYFMAPAQLDRRMMSQMDLMAELTDCCVAWRLPLTIVAGVLVPLGMFKNQVVAAASGSPEQSGEPRLLKMMISCEGLGQT